MKRRRWNPNGIVAVYLRRRGARRARLNITALLDSPEGDVIRRRVDKGAAWLARRDPEWAEKIKAAVKDGRFHLGHCQRCAVGTVLGDYSKFERGHQTLAPSVAHGFNVNDEVLLREHKDDELYWAATEQAWVDKVYGTPDA